MQCAPLTSSNVLICGQSSIRLRSDIPDLNLTPVCLSPSSAMFQNELCSHYQSLYYG